MRPRGQRRIYAMLTDVARRYRFGCKVSRDSWDEDNVRIDLMARTHMASS